MGCSVHSPSCLPIFATRFFFPLQFLWIKKDEGEEKREASLRDTGDIAESNSGKGLSAKMMDVTGEPESNRAWPTAKEVTIKAIHAWPERESFISVFLLFFLPDLWLCYSHRMLLGGKNKHSSAVTACNRWDITGKQSNNSLVIHWLCPDKFC